MTIIKGEASDYTAACCRSAFCITISNPNRDTGQNLNNNRKSEASQQECQKSVPHSPERKANSFFKSSAMSLA